MAKQSRSRKKTDDSRPTDHRLSAVLARDAQWVVDGPAYSDFDARIDRELETLVSQWIHVAAPGSSSIRRIIRQAARRASGQV